MPNEEDNIIESENNESGEEATEYSEEESEESETEGERPTEAPEARLARFERQAKQLRKKLGKEEKPEVKKEEAEQPTGELDNADYALLAAKGYEEDDEIGIISKYMKKWDLTLREVLKDEDIKDRILKLRRDKDVKNATPSGTRRGGSQSESLEVAMAKFEKDGTLPKDFDLKIKVIEAIEAKENTNKPRWK